MTENERKELQDLAEIAYAAVSVRVRHDKLAGFIKEIDPYSDENTVEMDGDWFMVDLYIDLTDLPMLLVKYRAVTEGVQFTTINRIDCDPEV